MTSGLRRDVATMTGQLVSNPYPVYHVMRKLDPVHWSAGWQAWFVTGHTEVSAFLKDPRCSVSQVSDFSRRLQEPHDMTLIEGTLANWMIFIDPPRHTRLRALISRAFTPRTLQRMEAAVEARVAALLDRIDPRGGSVDLLAALANPLPVLTVTDILGAEGDFQNWSHKLATFLGDDQLTPGCIRDTEEAILGLRAYFSGLVASRRECPQDDLVSTMVAAREGDDALSNEEVVAMAMLLFAAGHDTTTNLIGNGLLALLQHSAERRKLLADPSRAEAAVEEILRWDSPVTVVSRHVREDMKVAGKPILAGQLVNLCVAAANRDPQVFPDPDRFDLDRDNSARHLSFGKGIHFCVGAHLARLEARYALNGVLGRWPGLRLAGPVSRYPTLAFRRLQHLKVELLT